MKKLSRSGDRLASRRTVLRGIGVTMALPWLESLQTLSAAVTSLDEKGSHGTGQPPKRFACLLNFSLIQLAS